MSYFKQFCRNELSCRLGIGQKSFKPHSLKGRLTSVQTVLDCDSEIRPIGGSQSHTHRGIIRQRKEWLSPVTAYTQGSACLAALYHLLSGMGATLLESCLIWALTEAWPRPLGFLFPQHVVSPIITLILSHLKKVGNMVS